MSQVDDTYVLARPAVEQQPVGLARRLGLFDATMLVMGGIVGAGIFMNPYVVARHVHTPFLIVGAWVVGGGIAMLGAFVYAELAARLPKVGGQYAYIREAFHPLPAFLFSWTALLVVNSGGMAAVGMTFARYFIELTGVALPEQLVTVMTLAVLATLNCFGVRLGSSTQNTLMIIKIAAILFLVTCGYLLITDSHASLQPIADRPLSLDLITTFGAALVPVMFAYGGWHTTNFIAGEIREPEKNLPRGLVLGIGGVIALYVAVNIVSVRALGPERLAESITPASTVMRIALGDVGAMIIAIGIAISTLGYLSQAILTVPRLYYAAAQDGFFLKGIAKIHPRTRVPIGAIILQGTVASIITLTGTYEAILSFIVSTNYIFHVLTASCVFVLRRREQNDNTVSARFSVPGHPVTTILFIVTCALVVVNTVYKFPVNSLIGYSLVFSGIPVYFISRRVYRP